MRPIRHDSASASEVTVSNSANEFIKDHEESDVLLHHVIFKHLSAFFRKEVGAWAGVRFTVNYSR